MALKQFLSSAIKWVPQPGFSVVYTENGGIEASQDVLVRNADLRPGSVLTVFDRGTRWEVIFPEVPTIYRNLTLKTHDPADRGDGYSIVKCTFTGYQFAGNGSSGDEQTQATSTLAGQLNSDALSSHPKWEPLTNDEKFGLGLLLSGQAVSSPDFTKVGSYNEETGQWRAWQNDSGDILLTGDAIQFAKIITEGDSTWDKGGWTYQYHTESAEGFTAAQLNSIGKIVANPPGDPKKPGADWTWQLASPNQTQSGPDRFMKTLDFRLILDNEKNRLLYS